MNIIAGFFALNFVVVLARRQPVCVLRLVADKKSCALIVQLIFSQILTDHKDSKAVRHILLCDVDTHEIFDDLITLTVVNVPTVVRTDDISNNLYIFARFFSISSQQEADIFTNDFNSYKLGKELIAMYNKSVMNVPDLTRLERLPYFTERLTESEIEEIKQEIRQEALQKGIQEGRQKGIQEGIQEGVQKGRQEGLQEAQRQTAKIMLMEGISEELIKKCTGLDAATINSLRDFKTIL